MVSVIGSSLGAAVEGGNLAHQRAPGWAGASPVVIGNWKTFVAGRAAMCSLRLERARSPEMPFALKVRLVGGWLEPPVANPGDPCGQGRTPPR
jgi:hypothetical protein